jgi:YNFM family putative membrane transporter
MNYHELGSPEYRKALAGMLLGSLVTFATLYAPQTLISVFSEHYHVAPATASFSISLTTGTLAVTMLLISILSNAWSRKKMMVLSLTLTSLLTILSAWSHTFNGLLFVRTLEGITLAGFPAIAMTYISEEFSPRSIGVIMGVYVAGNGVGAFVGRAVIGCLTDLFSWQLALLGLGSVSLLCSLWFFLILPDSQNFHRVKLTLSTISVSIKAGLNNKKLLCLYGIGFLLMGIYVTLFNYIGYPLRKAPYHLNQTALSFIFAVNLIGSWGSVGFGKIADRYPKAYIMGGATLLLFGGALLTLNSNLLIKVIGLVSFAFGFFAGHTTACGWVGVVAPRQNKAQAAALYLFFYYTGSSLIGWFGGFFWLRWGWPGVVGLIGVLLGFTVWLALQTAAHPLSVVVSPESPVPNHNQR